MRYRLLIAATVTSMDAFFRRIQFNAKFALSGKQIERPRSRFSDNSNEKFSGKRPSNRKLFVEESMRKLSRAIAIGVSISIGLSREYSRLDVCGTSMN